MDYKIMERSMRLHASKEELEDALLQDIKFIISEDIIKFGKATILLSGGSTPSGLYRKLSSTQLDWSKVIVGLVDERFVENSSDYSNEKLIKFGHTNDLSIRVLDHHKKYTNFQLVSAFRVQNKVEIENLSNK